MSDQYMPCHICGAEPFTEHESVCSAKGWVKVEDFISWYPQVQTLVDQLRFDKKSLEFTVECLTPFKARCSCLEADLAVAQAQVEQEIATRNASLESMGKQLSAAHELQKHLVRMLRTAWAQGWRIPEFDVWLQALDTLAASGSEDSERWKRISAYLKKEQ